MHVLGFSVDLNLVPPFLLTFLLFVYGFILVVKNAASKYFVVDAGFEGAGGGVAENCRPAMVGRKTEKGENFCEVCGQLGSKRCSMCKTIYYCSPKCQQTHWRSGHKKLCGRIAKSNGRKTKQILFLYDEFVKLFNWDTQGFPPCGLLNCGNSCFANVVLQCLTFTRPLVAYLLMTGHRRECMKEEWCFLCEFQNHVERASKSNQAFSPLEILNRLSHIGGNLGYGNQEDAHEFMRFAIDRMQSVCLDQFGGEKTLHPSSQETTLIQYIFGGHLQSQVICLDCNKYSYRYENMMDLTVEIQGDHASLEECLDQFTALERLHGDNMYKCDGCNAYVKASKRLTVHQPPNILTVALKRFQGGRFGKLNKRVTFPETLDLSPYMTNAVDCTNMYKLYAVVVHIDMLNASYFGHYICYIKDFHGDWYRVDDCKVANVELEEVLSQAAYMLLYSRVHPRLPCQMPTELSKKQPPAEEVDSSSTSYHSVATTASVSSVSSSCDAHNLVIPSRLDCNDGKEATDKATTKYTSYAHESDRSPCLSSAKRPEVNGNGYLNHGSGLPATQETDVYGREQSNSGSNSSTSKYLDLHGSAQSIRVPATSPLLGKHPRDNSWEEDRNDISPSSHFQGLPEEPPNGVGIMTIETTDPMEICDEVSAFNNSHCHPDMILKPDSTDQVQFSNQVIGQSMLDGTLPSCSGQEKPIDRPTDDDSRVGADSRRNDECNANGSRQRNRKHHGLFERGFLNQNGSKCKIQMNTNDCSPSSGEPSFKNLMSNPSPSNGLSDPCLLTQNGIEQTNQMTISNCYPLSGEPLLKNGRTNSPNNGANRSTDTSLRKKLCSDVEEELCADVNGHMNMCSGDSVSSVSAKSTSKHGSEPEMTSPFKDVWNHLGSSSQSSSPSTSPGNKLCPDMDEHPQNGSHFPVVDNGTNDIKSDEKTPYGGSTSDSSRNDNPESLSKDKSDSHVNGNTTPANRSFPKEGTLGSDVNSPGSSTSLFCSDVEVSVSSVSHFFSDVEICGSSVSQFRSDLELSGSSASNFGSDDETSGDIDSR